MKVELISWTKNPIDTIAKLHRHVIDLNQILKLLKNVLNQVISQYLNL